MFFVLVDGDLDTARCDERGSPRSLLLLVLKIILARVKYLLSPDLVGHIAIDGLDRVYIRHHVQTYLLVGLPPTRS